MLPSPHTLSSAWQRREGGGEQPAHGNSDQQAATGPSAMRRRSMPTLHIVHLLARQYSMALAYFVRKVAPAV